MSFDLVRTIEDVPVSTRCRALGVSEQGFYSYLRRRKSPGVRAQQDAVLTDALVTAHRVSRETYGTRRLRTALVHKGLITSRRRISRINRAIGIKVRQRKRLVQIVKTTQSAHDSPIAPNLLARQFYPDAPNKVWVTDITYLRSGTHWIYLCSIVDCFSGRVVGRRISPAIDAQLVCDAMAMAVRNRRPGAGCIVHSDRGSQYASDASDDESLDYTLHSRFTHRRQTIDQAVLLRAFLGILSAETQDAKTYAERMTAFASSATASASPTTT